MFNKIKSEIGRITKMINYIKIKLNKKFTEFENSLCQHIIDMVKLLLITRILNKCKWSKEQDISCHSTTKKSKLRILEHK